jgi:exopolysaccharide production protein ExoQ
MVLTKSVGGIITLGIALGAFGVFALAARLPARARPGFFIGALLLGLSGFGLFLILESSGILEAALRSFGKDTTLTGRTFLWQRAAQLIDLNPLLGVGYQAFWVQESVEAEGLWRLGKNAARTGFHLHNLYYATAVELGLVGVAVFGLTLVTVAVTILVNACRRPSLELAFFAALVVIFGSRAFIELDFLSPFSLGTLMLPLLWSYAAQAPGLARRPVAVRRPAGFHPLVRPLARPLAAE